MRVKWLSLMVLAVIAFLMVPWNHSVTSSDKESPPRKDGASVPADPTLQEILRIREETGSPLRGSLLEKLDSDPKSRGTAKSRDASESFAETLKRVADEKGAAEPAREVPPSPEALLPNLELPGNPTVEIVLMLRSTSRALDEKANDLEDLRQFENAERLRRLSKQIRSEARRLEAN